MFNLQTATLEELKSMAYDTLVQIEQLQKNLQLLNQAIVKKSQEPKINNKETKKLTEELKQRKREEELKFIGH